MPRRPGQADEHLEPLHGEVALVGQAALERGGQAAVGLGEEPDRGEPLVVERVEELSRCAVKHETRLSENTCTRKDLGGTIHSSRNYCLNK